MLKTLEQCVRFQFHSEGLESTWLERDDQRERMSSTSFLAALVSHF